MSNSVNETIKKIRKSRGISQVIMAEKLNLSRSTYAYKESTGSFNIDEYKEIANIFEVSLDTLTSKSDYNPYKSEIYNYGPQILQTKKAVFQKEEDFSNILTMNEIRLLRQYRNLSKEKKIKLKEYLSKLENLEE